MHHWGNPAATADPGRWPAPPPAGIPPAAQRPPGPGAARSALLEAMNQRGIHQLLGAKCLGFEAGGIPVHTIGDCDHVAKMGDAVRAGHMAALKIL